MDAERLAPTVGIVGALLLALTIAIPAVTVEGGDGQVAAYYAAGPVGISFVGMLALLETVVFLSGRQERTDPATAAGLAFVLSLSMLGVAALWSFSIDPTLLFSFDQQYSWLTYHRWSVVAAAFVTFVGGAWYARGVL